MLHNYPGSIKNAASPESLIQSTGVRVQVSIFQKSFRVILVYSQISKLKFRGFQGKEEQESLSRDFWELQQKSYGPTVTLKTGPSRQKGRKMRELHRSSPEIPPQNQEERLQTGQFSSGN